MQPSRLALVVVVAALARAGAVDGSCDAVDDVGAALSRLPSIVKPPGRRNEMTGQLRLLGAPPLAGLRSRCFVERVVSPYEPLPSPWWQTARAEEEAAVEAPLGPGESVGCLPGILVLGAHKTGTTDMYHRLARHPDVAVDASRKESNFWCYAGQERKNGWYAYATRGPGGPVSRAVEEHWHRSHPFEAGRTPRTDAKDDRFEGRVARAAALVGVDGTPALAYCRTGGGGEQVTPGFARSVLGPGARVVAMVRDPADRAYSDYRYFASFQRDRSAAARDRRACACGLPKLPGDKPPFVYRYAPSLDHFDAVVRWEAARVDACVALGWDDRGCAEWACGVLQDPPFAACPPGRLLLGLYDAFLGAWERAFNCDTAKVPPGLLRVRVEDVARRPAATMRAVAAFVGLDARDAAVLAALASPNRTRPEDAHDRNQNRGTRLPPMRNATRHFLDAFYARHAATRLPDRLHCRGAAGAAPPVRVPSWARPPMELPPE